MENTSAPTGQDQDSIVDGVRAELEEIDASDLTEHAARFEALHQKLGHKAKRNADEISLEVAAANENWVDALIESGLRAALDKPKDK